jgi:hypothetical protein
MSAGVLVTVSCRACGGAVGFPAGEPAPRCLFCDAPDPVPLPPPEGVEPPAGFLPFRVDEAGARAAFRRYARASVWRPGDLRDVRLSLGPLLLPAWSWSARLETHWMALVPAANPVAQEPRTGVARFAAQGVLLPASATLTRAELAGICPFSPDTLREPDAVDVPYELGTLTRTAASAAGFDGLRVLHEAALRAELHPRALRTTSLFSDVHGGPLWLPVYIAAYRYGGRLHRVVINGQTGRLVGTAPVSWLRVGCAVSIPFLALAAGVAAVLLAAVLQQRGLRLALPW